MEYTHLGRSGLSVSRLCLGTMNFGHKTEEVDAFAIMDSAHDAGINFFDTANVYGWVKGEGITENIIGRWFAQGDGRRERTVLATKLYGSMSDWPNDTFLSARNIRMACDASLRRLQTDYIDLYQMHHIDVNTPWDEIWEAFSVLRQQGKVLYFGSSNFAAWNIVQCQEAAKARHFLGLISDQSIYNLLQRTIELEVLPAARNLGIGIIPWSPLMGGLLSGVLKKPREGRSADARTLQQLEQYRPQIAAFEAFCEERNENPALVGLAWLLHQPGVTAPIIGPRTLEQLENTLGTLDIILTEKDLAHLDEISPGPGPAPQAYAW